MENFAATTTTGDINIFNTGNLNIVDTSGMIPAGPVGVTITAGGTGDNITILAASPIVVNAVVTDTGGGNVLLAAQGSTSTDDMTIGAAISAAGANGNVTLYAGDDILQTTGDVTAAGSGTVSVYAGVDYNSGTAQAGNADASITQTSGRTMSSTSGDITLTATTDVALSILSTTGNVSVTADDDTYSLANNVGEITDNLTGETAANIIAAIATLRAATGIGSLDDIETNITTLDALNSTSGNLLITEIAAGTDLNINRATQSALGNLLVQTTNGTLTVVADQNGVAVTTGTLTLIAGDSDTSYTEDLVINDTVTSTTGLVTLTSSGDDVTFGAGGDVTTTSGNVQVNAESGAGLGEGIITMTDGALIDSGTAQIDLNAYGDITLGGLTTTYTADNAVAVTSVAGGIVDGGDIHTDIVANTASAIADLDAATGIGSANALETSIFNLEANNTTSGNIKISETDAINLTEIINSGTGSIDVTAGGTMTTTTITGGGAVNLNATSGDIQDTATGKITAVGNSSLRASGIIGTRTNPIDVDVDGELWVWAGSEQDEVSAVLQGTVHTAASTERVEIYEPTPPGLVLFDNHIMGGGNSGSGSTGGSILGFGYGYVISEKSSLLSPLNAQVIQPWGYNIENIIINEQFLQGPPVVIDGSAVGVDVISPDLLISPEKFLPGVNQYIIYSQPEMGQRINKSKRPLLLTKR